MATPAQRRANAKYHKENIASLACRVKKEEAEQFKEYCEKNSTTVNAVLKEYVMKCLTESL